MINTVVGTKVGMGQAFVSDKRTPVTMVRFTDGVVVQILTEKKNGYWGVQIGFGEKKASRLTKPLAGHLKGAIKTKKVAPNFLLEIKTEGEPEVKVGDSVSVSEMIKEGDLVSVASVSKGKGFAGGVKRWGFAGGPKTHGQSDRHRAPGSIGQGSTPGRVRKGKKMAGRMGGDQVTLKNRKIVGIDSENNLIKIAGPIAGAVGSRIIIKKI